MSSGARMVIGVASALGAVGFVLTGVFLAADLPAGSWPFYLLAAFWGVVALACFVRRSQPVTSRIIGTVVFAAYVVYAIDSVGQRGFFRAIAGLLIIGLPAAYVAITGGYPSWGKHGAAFRSNERPSRLAARRSSARGSRPRLPPLTPEE